MRKVALMCIRTDIWCGTCIACTLLCTSNLHKIFKRFWGFKGRHCKKLYLIMCSGFTRSALTNSSAISSINVPVSSKWATLHGKVKKSKLSGSMHIYTLCLCLSFHTFVFKNPCNGLNIVTWKTCSLVYSRNCQKQHFR